MLLKRVSLECLFFTGFENTRLLAGQRYTFFQRSYFDPTDLSDNESGNYMPIVQTRNGGINDMYLN